MVRVALHPLPALDAGSFLRPQPRCVGSSNGAKESTKCVTTSNGVPKSIITEWVATMSAFIKGIDPNHMVSVGDEGFYW